MKQSPVERDYAAQLGADKLAEQKAAAERRCSYCWAEPGEAHIAICPNRPEDEEPAVPTQPEALF